MLIRLINKIHKTLYASLISEGISILIDLLDRTSHWTQNIHLFVEIMIR